MTVHAFRESLKEGKKGEQFYTRWMKEQRPEVEVRPATFQEDKGGVDFFLVQELRVQVKYEQMAHKTGNIFVETESSEGVVGWGARPVVDHLVILVPGLGLIITLNPCHLALRLNDWALDYGTKKVPNQSQGRSWTTVGIAVPIPEVAVLGKTEWSTNLLMEWQGKR